MLQKKYSAILTVPCAVSKVKAKFNRVEMSQKRVKRDKKAPDYQMNGSYFACSL